jgi:glycosyltransferase involved in cell wall biosynthesis
MRIAQVAPLYESVPPKLYGGTERVVSYLTEEMVRQGHEVTLYASGDSETSARLVPGCPKALWRDSNCKETLPHHIKLVERVVRDSHRFDVIHFHLDYVHLPALRRLECPTVTSIHGALHHPDHWPLFSTFPEAGLVSISDDQRRPVPSAHWLGTVHHGLPRDLHTFRENPGSGSYLAFLGRISPEKGVDKAVEIARQAGMPLKVAAKIYPEEQCYFDEVIEPLFKASPWVDFVGEVGGAAKDAFLGNAHALLFPINWSEPFGLVMIEAMACGTPVVAFRRGSVPEVMVEGVTGFVVNDVAGAVEAVSRVGNLSRRACRQLFLDRYDAARMARDYLAIYRKLVDSAPRRATHSEDWTNHRPALHSHAGGLLGPVGVVAQRPSGV